MGHDDDNASDVPERSESPSHQAPPPSDSIIKQLSILDRFLSVWVFLAMVVGLLIGYFEPSVGQALQSVSISSVSVPVALGLILMIIPVFCKVPFENLKPVFAATDVRMQLMFSAVMNWILGPFLMMALGWATLPDLPDYRNGLILIGLARCIAMVALWNSLAHGSIEYCAILIAMNSLFQMLFYSPLAVLLIGVISNGHSGYSDMLPFFRSVTISVLIYLGIPLVLGVSTRYTLRRVAGNVWYDSVFIPRFSPLALGGLLYTIVVLFAVQGRDVINEIGPASRVAVPMLLYFMIMFSVTLLLAYYFRFPYKLAVTQAFTASSNNFELAIAIAVGTFGVTSPAAVAAVVGPLIEVPVLLFLVSVALRLQPWWERNVPTPVVGASKCDADASPDADAIPLI